MLLQICFQIFSAWSSKFYFLNHPIHVSVHSHVLKFLSCSFLFRQINCYNAVFAAEIYLVYIIIAIIIAIAIIISVYFLKVFFNPPLVTVSKSLWKQLLYMLLNLSYMLTQPT